VRRRGAADDIRKQCKNKSITPRATKRNCAQRKDPVSQFTLCTQAAARSVAATRTRRAPHTLYGRSGPGPIAMVSLRNGGERDQSREGAPEGALRCTAIDHSRKISFYPTVKLFIICANVEWRGACVCVCPLSRSRQRGECVSQGVKSCVIRGPSPSGQTER